VRPGSTSAALALRKHAPAINRRNRLGSSGVKVKGILAQRRKGGKTQRRSQNETAEIAEIAEKRREEGIGCVSYRNLKPQRHRGTERKTATKNSFNHGFYG
jgi:hypothetical protein